MRFLISFALLSSLALPLRAVIGDNAPSIPATYVTSHPRLGSPDTAFLASVCTAAGGVTNAGDGCAMSARYRTSAQNWNSAAPETGEVGLIDVRRLLIAYLATKNNGTPNGTYLQKIKDFQNLSAQWSLTTGGGYWTPGLALPLAYDWIYADLDSGTRTSMCSSMDAMLTGFEGNIGGASPYNDQFYITGFKQLIPIIPALAMYPDCGGNSIAHLRFAMDLHLNMMLPTWKQVVGNPDNVASSDTDYDHGGGWHESWEYVNQTEGLNSWYLTSLLAWANASGRGIAFFITDNPWIKNWAYRMLYQVRPDWVMEPIDQVSRPHFQLEYCPPSGTCPEASAIGIVQGAYLGTMEGLAAIYNDPTLRGWARLVDWAGQTPDGLEPSTWPYYTPDSSSNSVNTKSASVPIKNFPGWGMLFFRTGWGEDDTFCTLSYRDNYWSHPVAGTGGFTCFNRGQLAIRSGTYRSGSAAPHAQYMVESIAQNTISIYDPSDLYNDELYPLCSHSLVSCSFPGGADLHLPFPNGGDERRVGSQLGNQGQMGGPQFSPPDPAMWYRNREYYHMGRLLAYAVSPGKYAYAAIDTTAAYGDLFSRNAHTGAFLPQQANSSNRSFRAQKTVRQFLWIPRGTAAYVVVYDQVISTNSSFTKKFLLHTINQPVISGNSFTVTRNDLVTADSFVGAWVRQFASSVIGAQGLTHCPTGCNTSSTQYQYNGKLYGWASWPATVILTNTGGGRQAGDAGHDFDVTDANGTTNWNECSISGTSGCGFGSVAGSDTANGPFAITAGVNDTLLISVDGGGNQTITLTPGGARTAAQVVSDINGTITGALATVEGKQQIGISSNNTTPSTASIGIVTVANNAYATLGFTVGTYSGSFNEGLGSVGGFMHPNPLMGPQQPGSWRMEETTGTTQLSDQFVNVMLVTSASDTNVVSTAPVTTLSGNTFTTTWKDNSNTCTYTWTHYLDGVGGGLTITGAGCSATVM
jgi:hypothetical protein